MSEENIRIVLASRPQGVPTEDNFRLDTAPIPDPKEGEILIRTRLSVDPYMREERMNAGASYAPGVELDEVMVGGAVGDVVASCHPHFSEGDVAQAPIGWQSHGVACGEDAHKVDPRLWPISTALGVLGMPGMTAYFGLLDVGQPCAGETVVVSGAAGAVGSVGQIAQIKGCRTVGIAGSDAKVDYICNDLGFAGGFNYKTASDYGEALGPLCPDGIDVYFDNVGGSVSDAVFLQLNIGARISVCGQISQYNLKRPERGLRQTWLFITKRLHARLSRLRLCRTLCRALHALAGWVREGKLSLQRRYRRRAAKRAGCLYWHAAGGQYRQAPSARGLSFLLPDQAQQLCCVALAQ